jgi:hypothetical protein
LSWDVLDRSDLEPENLLQTRKRETPYDQAVRGFSIRSGEIRDTGRENRKMGDLISRSLAGTTTLCRRRVPMF